MAENYQSIYEGERMDELWTLAGTAVQKVKVNGQTYNPVAGLLTLPNYPTELTWAAITGKPSWIGETKPSYTLAELTGDSTHRVVTDAQITAWGNKYDKPSSGIPATDLATAVQTSLGKADSAYQKPSTGIPTADIANSAITTAKIGNKQVTIDKLSQAVQDILGYFTLEGEGTAASPYYLHTIYNLCSDNEITAGGVGTGGSGGGGIVALYAKTSGNDVRLDDTETRQAKFGISVNGSLVTPTNGVFNINTSGGSVTSVGLSVPTGFTTGQPVTSSGNLTLGFASGYSLVSSSDRTAWNGKQNALGYTPVNKAGDTMNGSLELFATGSLWNEGIRMHLASDNWVGLVMCGSDNTGATGTSAKTWSIHNNDGHAYFVNNGSTSYTYGFDWTNGGALTMKASSMAFNVRPTVNGTNVAFTSDIPTNNNQLANGAGYITSSGSCAYATNAGQLGGLGESRYFRKNLIYTSADCNTMEANSFTILDTDSGGIITCANKPTEAYIDGGYGVLTVKHGAYANQLFFPYGGGGDVYARSQVYSGAIIWGSWNKLYHSGNCNNTSTAWSASTLNTYNISNGTRTLAFSGYSLRPISSEASSIDLGSSDYRFGTIYSDVMIAIGNVGIGTTSPSEKLHVAGNVLATGEITAGSDARWKHNITPVVNGIDAIMKLNPCTWEWNSDNHKGSGLVAQDVQSVIPHLVKTDGEGYLHLTYDGLHAYEISAIQSHETRIERLERENAELKRQLQLKS